MGFTITGIDLDPAGTWPALHLIEGQALGLIDFKFFET